MKKTSVIRIGISRGTCGPKPILEQVSLEGEGDLVVKGNAHVISEIHKPRSGWSERFSGMRAHDDDALLDSETATFSSWDDKG